ncbi:MAG: DUF433 domain-containing protein [Candidatus Nanohaloarchaea archaeon]
MVEESKIVRTEGVIGGKPRVKDTRVSVEAIFELYDEGMKKEQIVNQLPSISTCDVEAALNYSCEASQFSRPGSRIKV